LLVTNACKELVSAANKHGTPDPEWLAANLTFLCSEGANLVLLCGKVAQATYDRCRFTCSCEVLRIPHPAARVVWSAAYKADVIEAIDDVKRKVLTATPVTA